MSKEGVVSRELFQKRIAIYQELVRAGGEEHAREKLLEGYPERQRQRMGALINGRPLADGFSDAIPLFRNLGMTMEVHDISTDRIDAVLEVQRSCPAMSAAREHGLDKPCRAICEIDVEATRRAFTGMKGEILSRQADGACVCVFKYERQKLTPEDVRPDERGA